MSRTLAGVAAACALSVASAAAAGSPSGRATQTTLTPSDGEAGLQFGNAVALSGDTAVIGTAINNGPTANRVYVFERKDGAWAESTQLLPTDINNEQAFGSRLAIDQDTILVSDDPLGVKVYVRGNAGWVSQGELVLPDGPGQYGGGLALSGDVAVVTTFQALYVFERSNGVWSLTTEKQLGTLPAGPVAVAGDTIGMLTPDGQLQMLGRQPGGQWVETDLLSAPEHALGKLVGPVVMSGDRLLVGGPQGPHVFERVAGTWTHEAQLVPSGGYSYGFNGQSVGSLSGDTAVVPEALGHQAGASYSYSIVAAIYRRGDSGWAKDDEILVDARLPSLSWLPAAISGDTILVGELTADPDYTGAVQVIELDAPAKASGCSYRPTGGGSSPAPLLLGAALALAIARRRKSR